MDIYYTYFTHTYVNGLTEKWWDRGTAYGTC